MIQQNLSVNNFQIGQTVAIPTQNYPERKFQINRLLGDGTEGTVYQALAINWDKNQQYAIKIHKTPQDEKYINFIESIIRHQGFCNQQESPFNQNSSSLIIRIYEQFFIHQNKLVIIMELGSMDLLQFQKQNANVPLQTIGNYCIQMAKSIQFIHKMSFIHRDIKPENFIIVGSFVKLIDFGLVKTNNSFYKTQNVGTPCFQAPEIVEGKSNYTYAVDIWSLGCVFYELIKKEQLFYSDSANGLSWLIKNHQSDQNQVNFKINQLQISDVWKKTLTQMLNPKPEYRQSIQEILQRIENTSIVISNPPAQSFPASFPIQQNPPQQNIILPQGQNVGQQMNQLIQNLYNPHLINQLKSNFQAKQQIEKLIEALKEVLGKISPNVNQFQSVHKEVQATHQNIQEKIDYVSILLQEIEKDQDYQNQKQNLMLQILDLYSKKQSLITNIKDYNQKLEEIKNLQMDEQQLKLELQNTFDQKKNELELQVQMSIERTQNQQVGERLNLSHEQILKDQQDKIVQLQIQLRVALNIEQLYKKNQQKIGQLRQEIAEKQITPEQLFESTLSLQKLQAQKQLLIEQQDKFNAQNEEIKELENQMHELQLKEDQIDKQVHKNQLNAKIEYLKLEIEKQENANQEIKQQNEQLLSELEIYNNQLEEFKKQKQEKEEAEKKFQAQKLKIQQMVFQQNEEIKPKQQPEQVDGVQDIQEIEANKQVLNFQTAIQKQGQLSLQQPYLEQQRVLQTDPPQNQFQNNFNQPFGNNQNNQGMFKINQDQQKNNTLQKQFTQFPTPSFNNQQFKK